MAEEHDPTDDEAYLDELFERFTTLRASGAAVDLEPFSEGREHLRERVLELWNVACRLGARAAPSVRVAGFELLEELGRGGMAIVYLAQQEALGGRPVALKLMLAGSLQVTPQDRRRFLTEARALARVRHPSVVEIYDVYEEGGTQAYAMEWIPGGTLAELVRRRRAGTTTKNSEQDPAGRSRSDFVPYVLQVGIQIGRALQAVHEAGLTHRDVKPSNILLRANGTPVLSDFGIVRDSESTQRTRTGAFIGTLAFAAPEQVRGEGVDARTDVYGLGATLFQLLTLEFPVPGATEAELLRNLEARGPRTLRSLDPRLPRDLDTVLAKALDVDPSARYASADELADDLQRLLSLQPIHARPQGLATRTWKLLRRNRRAVLAGVVAAVFVSLLAGLWAAELVRRSRKPAQIEALVRDARLALLDSDVGDQLQLVLRHGHPIPVSEARMQRALSLYGDALELDGSNVKHRAERDAVLDALSQVQDSENAEPARSATGGDVRGRGLRAYLLGDLGGAVQAWEALEADEVPDDLVNGLLGHAHMLRGHPERAYPRLLNASSAFPRAGFLHAAAARAALHCGDIEVARRLNRAARAAELPAGDIALGEVQADLAWIDGDLGGAREFYENSSSKEGYLRTAQALLAEGNLQRAVFAYGTMVANYPADVGLRRDFLRVARRWWSSIDADTRRQALAKSLRGERSDLDQDIDVGYVLGVLTQAQESAEVLRREEPAGLPAPFLVSGADDLFDHEIRERPSDNVEHIDRFAERIDARRIDVERLMSLAQSERDLLLDMWMEGDWVRAEALLDSCGARLASTEHAFGPLRDDLPAEVTLVAEINGLELGFAHIFRHFHTSGGDFDGDGIADLLIGSASTAMESAVSGRVSAYSGADGTLLYELRGEAYETLGAAVDMVGDIDGDSIADWVAGSPGIVGARPGFVSTYSGATGMRLHRIEGEPGFGSALAGLGDVDGDGVPDFAAGRATASEHGDSAGEVRVVDVHGRELWRVAGVAPKARFGSNLEGLGDLTGDGAFELLVAGTAGSQQRSASVLSGATGKPLEWTPEQEAAWPKHGFIPGLAGDCDGDGSLDIIMPDREPGHDEPVARLLSPLTGRVLATCRGQLENEGHALFGSTLGDLDGDGRSEFCVTSYGGRSPVHPRVRVYSSDGALLAELRGFIWLGRLGHHPLLPAPTTKRLYAISLDHWSRYSEGGIGGPARVVLLDWVAGS